MREILGMICTAGLAAAGAGFGSQSNVSPAVCAFVGGMVGGFFFWVLTEDWVKKGDT